MPMSSRYRGALLGLGVGDALGASLEFEPPGTFEPIDDMLGGGPFDLAPGEWTDDTSMALCLAESLVETGGFDPVDQLERYVRWWRDGYLSSTGTCFDIGIQTSSALAEFERTGSATPASPNPEAAGNGSLMRLCPVPMFYAHDLDEAVEMSGRSSLTTHPAPRCVDACRYFGALIAAAANGTPKDELLDRGFWRWGELHPEIEEVARGSFLEREPPEIKGSGYVVRSLEAALWAFDRSDNFRAGALLAVNLGDDADTTGAVFGSLAGAYYSEDGIPAEWRERLALRETIESLADALTTTP
jgi:ADP-ribosyl-[dinitrogen reductase] hydrolase